MAKTLQEVIDIIIAEVPEAPIPGSVDVFKSGDPQWEVTGIVTTFMPTIPVLKRAVELGANLVITHEPTFYEHHDTTAWLEDDSVYTAKRRFIEEHQLAIWRFHDYWHLHQPDGILTGVVRELGWEGLERGEHQAVLLLPEPLRLEALLARVKERLALPTVRIVGDPQMLCQRMGLLLGAIGGAEQIRLFRQANLDVVLCGETVEWQTCEYVRDSTILGQPKALVILGHARSEEAGMAYLAEWLRPKVPNLPITFVAAGDPVTLF